MLKFSNVQFSVPSQEHPILKTLDFAIQPKEFVIILGANGSGKSSLLKLISKDYLPSQGNIKNQAMRIAYLSQDTSFSLFHNLTVLENCCLNEQKIEATPFKVSTQSERTKYGKYLKAFHFQLPQKMQTLVGDLSGGERQSLALALALKQKPDLLLLDEHTSALDPKTAKTIMALTHQAIQDEGLTALMVTHNLEYALDYGTRVMGMKEGSIVLDITKKEGHGIFKDTLLFLYG